MPPMPGMDLGPEPPAVPRRLPVGFERRHKWTANPLALVGAIFSFVGWILLIAFLFALPLFTPLPLIFVILGWLLLRSGRKQAARVLNAFQHGRAVKGVITEVGVDTTLMVNGRHPWRICYTFETLDGQKHEGQASTFDSTAQDRQRGQPLWVLVVDDQPEQNTIYPPVR